MKLAYMEKHSNSFKIRAVGQRHIGVAGTSEWKPFEMSCWELSPCLIDRVLSLTLLTGCFLCPRTWARVSLSYCEIVTQSYEVLCGTLSTPGSFLTTVAWPSTVWLSQVWLCACLLTILSTCHGVTILAFKLHFILALMRTNPAHWHDGTHIYKLLFLITVFQTPPKTTNFNVSFIEGVVMSHRST